MKSLLLLFGVLLAAVLSVSPAGAAFPGRNGVIVYGSWSEHVASEDSSSSNDWSVGVLIRDGWEQTLARCTDDENPACTFLHYDTPAVSPDGFLVALGAGDAIALVGIHGGPLDLLPQRGERDGQPTFAPGGRQLAFSSGPMGGPRDVWISGLRGWHARRILAAGSAPAWSVGNWIAFERDGGIWRVRPDGSDARRLTAAGSYPTWSPDGRQLAFSRRIVRPGPTARHDRVFVMDADGSHLHRIPGKVGQGAISDVAWSPDGRKLLVASDFLMTIDFRRNVRRVVAFRGEGDINTAISIDWQPLPRR